MTREEACEFLRRMDWTVWLAADAGRLEGLLRRDEITPSHTFGTVSGFINLISMADAEPRILRAPPNAPLAKDYPWRVGFYGYRQYHLSGGYKTKFYSPRILFRTEEEAQACVTTLKLMWSVS